MKKEKPNNLLDAKTIQIVIASKNVHKIREIKAILSKYSELDILSLLDFPNFKAAEETANTFKENSKLKAEKVSKELNTWAIADDSGLIVPSINNEPGVFSARYAGDNATDKDNRKKLLEKTKHLKEDDRDCYFECCITLSSPEGIQKVVCATCEGILLKSEKGGGGFGYDPIFIKNDYNKSFAELPADVKNKISHRAKALDKLQTAIESILVTK